MAHEEEMMWANGLLGDVYLLKLCIVQMLLMLFFTFCAANTLQVSIRREY